MILYKYTFFNAYVEAILKETVKIEGRGMNVKEKSREQLFVNVSTCWLLGKMWIWIE